MLSRRKKLHLSIVGCGSIAGSMAMLARLTPGIELTACCDISSDRTIAFARKHKIPKVFTDYHQMLAESVQEAIYLAVPHYLHFEMIQAAIDAGVHVFTEKPITRKLAEGQEIVAYAREKNIKIGVNYQYRYDKACYRLVQTVQSGGIGRVFYGRTNIPWHRENSYFEGAPWHKTLAQAGGGTLITQASHLIDVLLWAIVSPPAAAYGYTAQKVFKDIEVEDFAAALVELENGVVLQITSSMAAASEQAVTIEIYGEQGTVVYTNRPWPRVKLRPGAPARREEYTRDSAWGKSSPHTPAANGRVPYWGLHAMHRSLQGFRDWVLRDRPFLIPGEAALPALAVVEAIYQSAEEGRQVEISH